MNSETAVHPDRSPQAVQQERSPQVVHADRSGQTTHAVIANITEQNYMAQRTYGTFQIPGRVAGEEYSLTRVTPRTAVIDYGDKRTLPLAITAREIAEDLCREVNSDAGENSFLGRYSFSRLHRGGFRLRAEQDRPGSRLQRWRRPDRQQPRSRRRRRIAKHTGWHR